MGKKHVLIILAALCVLTVALIAVMLAPQQMTSTPQAPTEDTSQQDTASQNATGPAAPGEYRDYQEGDIQRVAGTKILFFYAPWCPQCRALEKSIKEGSIPSGVTILKVDYDTNQALRQTYGISIQTSLARVDDTGKLLAKYVAYDRPTLQALIEHLL
jgi:thiol-disulfide isomerase/thioredoxin